MGIYGWGSLGQTLLVDLQSYFLRRWLVGTESNKKETNALLVTAQNEFIPEFGIYTLFNK